MTDIHFTKNPKQAARDLARRSLAKLGEAWMAEASAKIADRALAHPVLQTARVVGCYLSTPHEVQTHRLIAGLLKAGKRMAVPAWNRNNGSYAMCEFVPGEPIHTARMGVYEPVQPRWIDQHIDVMVVPLVAFDRYLRRLGHGGGNFDRMLASHTGRKMGLAFEAQRIAVIPVETHDVPLDLVVTEQRVYDGSNAWAERIEAPAEFVTGKTAAQ